MNMTFYEDGVLQVIIDEKSANNQRFRLSEHDMGASRNAGPRAIKPLINLKSYVKIQKDQLLFEGYSNDGQEFYRYTVKFHPFRIIQTVNNITTIIVNNQDTLFFESLHYYPGQGELKLNDTECLLPFFKSLPIAKSQNIFNFTDNQNNPYIGSQFLQQVYQEFSLGLTRESFMIGFTMESEDLYGLPERTAQFTLTTTDKTDPFRLYNVDAFPHKEASIKGLYSSLPYITGHSIDHDESIMLYNSAETWVDINKLFSPSLKNQQRKHVNIITEGGKLEFFIFASASNRFHYSKWEQESSAKRTISYSKEFDRHQIPLDVIWLDIPHTDGNRYFTFNQETFNDEDLALMSASIRSSQRRLVVITDPHIKQDPLYKTYSIGKSLDKEQDEDYNQTVSIFVKDIYGEIFTGFCWPGDSVWIDFLNPIAQEFWMSQYLYNNFKGTNDLFDIWIDMNEPSVFNQDETIMPKHNLHVLSNDKTVLHRDVHNAYGLLMSMATYKGLQFRDQFNRRPFILTRSSFFGSQKYAAKWTGDNRSKLDELWVSISQVMTLNLAGLQFVGPDVPGFYGNPTDDLFIMFYQLGSWYPFFRAHGHLEAKYREPYNQFYLAYAKGLPIARPLWYNFPKDKELFHISRQFMIGDSILICPKLVPQTQTFSNDFEQFVAQKTSKLYPVKHKLPKEALWYNYYTKEVIEGDSKFREVELNQFQQLVYIKGGSIIPLKLHQNPTSLLKIQYNPIRLEIYLNETNQAKGFIYLDDGSSFNYTNQNESTVVEYLFDKNVLSYKVINPQSFYKGSIVIKIVEITIYSYYSAFDSADLLFQKQYPDYFIQNDQLVAYIRKSDQKKEVLQKNDDTHKKKNKYIEDIEETVAKQLNYQYFNFNEQRRANEIRVKDIKIPIDDGEGKFLQSGEFIDVKLVRFEEAYYN
ncbi:neutral alpha-glucosidase ab [Stylonychia lemnae]|uniref:Neutral alpha-glucosidase ab n=1 Tax=Stylonychia lemnae TaxID=5949 RepID=A0A078A7L3_STYLE|nr:neutral alpha-glucosidase ab [Stylonychia lemnae]|eukprot:CDW76776.1 neutral alpha-glucosidase ab [Stylonychia lemnae]